jgi:hypothetical protein
MIDFDKKFKATCEFSKGFFFVFYVIFRNFTDVILFKFTPSLRSPKRAKKRK